jgi:DNA-binding response OmpR family regulator
VQWPRLKATLDRVRSEAMPGRALLIEDDQNTRIELRQVLEQEGWEVLEFMNGQDALQELALVRPGLILVNLQLPDMSGFSLLRELRRNPEWRTIPVIGVTEGEVTPRQRESLQGTVRQIVQAGDDASGDELVAELRRIASAAGRAPAHASN